MIESLNTPPRLGDDYDWGDTSGDASGIDWTAIAQTAIGTAGGIIASGNKNTGVVPPRIYTTPSANLTASGSIPSWLILAGVGLGAVLLLRK